MFERLFFRTHGLLFFAALLVTGCAIQVPENMTPVQGFEPERYTGRWFEIARLENRFEKGLSNITAHYELRADGSLSVLNRGFDDSDNEWKEASGQAYLVENAETGLLKVSFFGPFYAAYVIFSLDHSGYEYALVSGTDRKYFWLLARRPVLPEHTVKQLLETARENGFDTEKLVWVRHDGYHAH